MSLKRLVATAVIAAGLAASSMFVAGPAQASVANCPSGAACIWGDRDYVTAGNGGSYVSFQHYIPNYTAYTYNQTGYGANDSASSLYNSGNVSTVTFYRDANKGGWAVSWSKKTGDGYLVDNGIDDEISSGYFAGY